MIIPDMYVKSIFDINYDKLRKKNIKDLLYDFDNTILEKGNYEVSDKTIELFDKLKDDFIIYVVSNSLHSKKLEKVCKELKVPYIGKARKPFKSGYKKLKIDAKIDEIAMIGDQIITDVWGSKRMGYYSILIDPISKEEMMFTRINRKLEKRIMKNNNLVRGKYYD